MNILVAMSGGVDSSVAAALLQAAGHRVLGVTLRLLSVETGFGCCGSTRDIEDAKAVCAKLGMPHYVMDFSKTFEKNIMDPFVDTYLAGATPNPCIACNRFVKFDALLHKAVALGADAVATGHYARVDSAPGHYRLRRAHDLTKDQSYVLYHLGQAELAQVLFPLGDLTKAEVRARARELQLPTADKAESMEICFVPGRDTAAFVRERALATGRTSAALEEGAVVDLEGRSMGTHRGAAFYTRGQRSGIGAHGKRAYVVDIKPETNTIVVGDDSATRSHRFSVGELRWTRAAPVFPAEVAVQIRSRPAAGACRLTWTADGVAVECIEAQRAVSPGQAAVFYSGDEVLGGGVIRSA